MFKWFLKKIEKPKITLSPYGELRLTRPAYWFGMVNNFCNQTHEVELEIEVEYYDEPNVSQVEQIRNFSNNWESLEEIIFQELYDQFKSVKDFDYSKEITELHRMYYLVSVSLSLDGTFLVVLEPGDVTSIYNHFQRFTLLEGRIVKHNTD